MMKSVADSLYVAAHARLVSFSILKDKYLLIS